MCFSSCNDKMHPDLKKMNITPMLRLTQVTRILPFEDGVALHLINIFRSGYRGAIQNHTISSQCGDTAPNEIKYRPSLLSKLEILPLFLPNKGKKTDPFLLIFMFRGFCYCCNQETSICDPRYGLNGMYFPSPCNC